MNEEVKKEKGKHFPYVKIIIIIVIVTLIVLLLPFLVEFIHEITFPISFFNVKYSEAELLSYYGNVLIFLGTASISIVALFQSNKANDKLEKDNSRLLALENEKDKREKEQQEFENIPRFEIFDMSHNGALYANLKFKLKNISSKTVTDIKPVSFKVVNKDDKVLQTSDNLVIGETGKSFLEAGKYFVVSTNLPVSQNIENEKRPNKGFKFVFEFSCKNVKGSIYKFQAVTVIKTSREINEAKWNIQEIDDEQ